MRIGWFFLFLFLPTLCVGELPVQLTAMRVKVQTEKKAFVGKNIRLDKEQRKEFWPMYRKYQEALMKVNDRWGNLFFEFRMLGGHLTDEKADEFLKGYLSWEKEKLALKEKFFRKFKKILPAKIVARYFQLENKMEAFVAYDVAIHSPRVK